MKSFRSIIVGVAAIAALTASADEGKKWLAKAQADDVAAMHETASRYFYGYDGLPHDEAEARYWAEKGGEKGNVECMLLAALTYYDDIKTAKFDSKALEWNAKAGEAGSLQGAFNARNAMLALKAAAENEDDKLRALKGEIYWNEKMLAHPDLKRDRTALGQATQMREQLQKELDALMPPEPQPEVEPQQAAPAAKDEKLFIEVEQAPQFPGGDAALYGWLARNISYPAEAVEGNIQGRVIVQCVIEKDGSIGEVKVVRGKHPALDKEAVRLVKSMPKFTPGLLSGQPVRVWYTLPITFKLN